MWNELSKIAVVYLILSSLLFGAMAVVSDMLIYAATDSCNGCLLLDTENKFEEFDVTYPDVITDEERLDIYLEKYNGTVM